MRELKAWKKSDSDVLKSFLDTAEDNRRPAYERRAKKTKRHCVFAATTNDDAFLTDTTGNRRFPVLQCGSEQGDYVELTDGYVDQLWAEVLAKAQALFAEAEKASSVEEKYKIIGKKLELSRDAKQQVENVAKKFMRDDGIETEIKGFLDVPLPPQVIWKLLTREERRKFIAERSIRFFDGGDGLIHRRKASSDKNRDADVAALEALLTDKKVVKK